MKFQSNLGMFIKIHAIHHLILVQELLQNRLRLISQGKREMTLKA